MTGWTWMIVGLVAVATGCRAGSTIELTADPAVLRTDTGGVVITAHTRRSADSVRFYADRGRFTAPRSSNGAVTAALVGVRDVGSGFIRVQVESGSRTGTLVVPVVPGVLATLDVGAVERYVNADTGVGSVRITGRDAAGTIVDLPDLDVVPVLGTLRSLLVDTDGSYVAQIEGLHDTSASPVSVHAVAGGLQASAELQVLAGAAATYGAELPQQIEAGAPFTVTFDSRDQFGNLRNAFGETAWLSAWRLSDPDTPIPVSPSSTNLFEGGRVTMQVTIHGFGPDIMLRIAATTGDTAIATEIGPLSIVEPVVGCVIVQPQGLLSRVQPANTFVQQGGLPLDVIVSRQSCTSVRDDGEQLVQRLVGFSPQVWVRLNDGTLWGTSETSETPADVVGGVAYLPDEIAYRVHVTGLTDTDWTPALVTAVAGERVGALELEITPGEWQSVTFSTVPDAFFLPDAVLDFGGAVTIATGPLVNLFATDIYGNIVATADGNVDCALVATNSDAPVGQLSGTATFNFVAGAIAQVFGIQSIDNDPQDARLRCSNSAQNVLGYSNAFRIFSRSTVELASEGFPSDFMLLLPGQYPAESVVPGFPQYVTGTVPDVNFSVEAGEPFEIEIVARFGAPVTGGLPFDPGALDTPVYEGNVLLAPLFGGLNTLGSSGTTPLSDSPLSKRLGCVEGTVTIFPFPPAPTCSPIGADADKPPFYRVRQRIAVFQAADNQVLTVNPLFSNTSAFPSASSAFTVRPAALYGLRFSGAISDTVPVGVPADIQVEAVDRYGNRVTSATLNLVIEDLTGTVWPKQAMLNNGVATVTLQFWTPMDNNLLIVRDAAGNYRIQSGLFRVE